MAENLALENNEPDRGFHQDTIHRSDYKHRNGMIRPTNTIPGAPQDKLYRFAWWPRFDELFSKLKFLKIIFFKVDPDIDVSIPDTNNSTNNILPVVHPRTDQTSERQAVLHKKFSFSALGLNHDTNSDKTNSNPQVKDLTSLDVNPGINQFKRYKGHISTIYRTARNGFVKTKDQVPGAERVKRFYYCWSKENDKDFEQLQLHTTVLFTKNPECTPEKPNLSQLWIVGPPEKKLPMDMDRLNKINGDKRPSTVNEEVIIGQLINKSDNTDKLKKIRPKPIRHLGSVVAIVEAAKGEQSFGFIRPEGFIEPPGDTVGSTDSVMFHTRSVKPNGVTLEKGDRVKFVLRKQSNNKLYASRVYLQGVSPKRNEESMECLLKGLIFKVSKQDDEDYKKETHNYFITDILKSHGLWESIGNFQNLNSTCIEIMMDLIIELDLQCAGLVECFQCVLKTLLDTQMFNAKHSKVTEYLEEVCHFTIADQLNKSKRFLQVLATRVPAKLIRICKLIKPLLSKNLEGIDTFLWALLRLSISENDSPELQEWKELQLVPSPQEIIDGPLEGFNVRPMKIKGPYESTEEYMDINFRLFRADCFHALNTGVRALLNGTLDHRDMNAYHSLRFHGVRFADETAPLVAISITPFKPVANWDRSSRLMFGNLVCISITGTFKDPIWATVAGRDLLKTHNIVILQLCSDCNALSDADAMIKLQRVSSKSFMVESPTYYRSYQPILSSIQSMDPKDLVFEEELVQTAGTKEPGFCKSNTTFKLQAISATQSQKFRLAKMEELDINELHTTLDVSQQDAIKQCLKNRVAIVQGPPGTGKTYLGVKLVQILDSFSTKPETPILVLTYKNHALDEFMKQMLEIFPNEVARIGGKADNTLDSINLKTLKRSHILSPQLRDQLDELDIEITDCNSRLQYYTEVLTETLDLDFINCVKYLTSKQIKQLFEGFDCSKHKIPSLLRDDAPYMDWRQNVKKNPNKDIDRFEIEFLLTYTGEIKSYLESFEFDMIPNMRNTILQVLELSFQDWMVPYFRYQKQQLTATNLSTAMEVFPTISVQVKSKGNPGTEVEDEDEEDVKAEEKKRMSELNIKECAWKSGDFTPFRCTQVDYLEEAESSVRAAYFMTEDIMKMTERERIVFLQFIVQKERHQTLVAFKEEVQTFKTLQNCKSELRRLHDLQILQSKKVVGMTITGVNIHASLISQLKPAIIIVEEAAEVTEPQILSVLGPWVEQLILIGDHKQLRPNVQCFELKRNFHLDVSMMERLIMNGHPYSKLKLQNRMRTEFAEMLLDIYPDLSSNLARVQKNKAPNVTSSMYFWSHSNSEISGLTQSGEQSRSFTNPEEADRCLTLALFFCMFGGYKPCQITILAAYLGQKTLLRRKFYEATRKHNKLFQLGERDSTLRPEYMFNIQTIDNYQGDENNIVIVSLVRSNGTGKTGFLNTINRRCVAQSRAKCGMYFVGDDQTLNYSKHWQVILRHMKDQNCLGPEIALHCPYHTEEKLHASNSSDIPLHPFCERQCTQRLPCTIHQCMQTCQPLHDHSKCRRKIHFSFSNCGHIGTRMCFQDDTKMRCLEEIQIILPCSHTHTRKCYEQGDLIQCKEKIPYTFKECGHVIEKECYKSENELKCREKVPSELLCGHTNLVACGANIFNDKCTLEVTIQLQCNHVAKRKCYEQNSAYICRDQVTYERPCGHFCERDCSESESIKCTLKCFKTLQTCGHLCSGLCGEPCTENKCQTCAKKQAEVKRKLQERIVKDEKERINKELSLIKDKKLNKHYFEVEIDKNEHEYFRVQDTFRMYIRGDWNPKIKTIERFHYSQQYANFLTCKLALHDPSIVVDLFMSSSNHKTWHNLAGKGLQFTADPTACISVDAVEATIVLCSVAIGKSFTVEQPDADFTCMGLIEQGFDSVFVSPTQLKQREFYLIYRANQLMPKYRITFEKEAVLLKPLVMKVSSDKNPEHEVHILLPKSNFDVNDTLDMHFRLVESQFHRLHNKNPKFQKPTIAKIEYHLNRKLNMAFKAKEIEMKERLNDPQKVLAFHGTQADSIESIVRNGFDMTKIKRTVHGHGIYLSEFPKVSCCYGTGLLLCHVLTGNTYTEKEKEPLKYIPEGYDSISVKPVTKGHHEMLVIGNSDQILPSYVVYLDNQEDISENMGATDIQASLSTYTHSANASSTKLKIGNMGATGTEESYSNVTSSTDSPN